MLVLMEYNNLDTYQSCFIHAVCPVQVYVLKLTTVSGCSIISLSSSREGHARALIANAAVWNHSSYMFTWHRKFMISPNDRQKRNHLGLKKFHEHGTLLTFKGQWIFML